MGPILRKSNLMPKYMVKFRGISLVTVTIVHLFGLVSYNRRISARLSQFYVFSGRNDCAH